MASTYSDTGYRSSWEVSRGQSGTVGRILILYSGGGTTLAMKTKLPLQLLVTIRRSRMVEWFIAVEFVFPGATGGMER